MPETQEKILGIDLEDAGLAQRISQALIQAILEHKLRGGDRLLETELQKQFKVSRSPLREALRDLENKGLVVIKPRRGTFVKKITRRDIDEHYPVQAALEGLAARQALEHMGPRECREMSAELTAMEEAARQGDAQSFFERHGAFHNIYIQASRNQLLIDMIMELRLRGVRLRYFFPHTPAYCQQSIHVHRRIRDELCAGDSDPEQVERIVRGHIAEMLSMDGWEL